MNGRDHPARHERPAVLDVVEHVDLLARFNAAYLAVDVTDAPILPLVTPGPARHTLSPLPERSLGPGDDARRERICVVDDEIGTQPRSDGSEVEALTPDVAVHRRMIGVRMSTVPDGHAS